ncbi:MAG: tRNA adenosine(34) deaminase TadA [Pseudanabaenaceae cyanobacterium bins.39]|nr:tRNA adenosine(34) deaminase TadA [Pseudanabaenaceae cyanobacterium bins.39]
MDTFTCHQYWMDQAIALAMQAGQKGEIPVGAIIVNRKGEAIATGVNRKERDRDPTGHAEIVAIRKATRIRQNWHLTDCTIYVTLEPCPMCAGAIIQSRLNTLVYGAADPKTGAIRTVANIPDSPVSLHRLAVVAGIREHQCQVLLQNWFQKLRG